MDLGSIFPTRRGGGRERERWGKNTQQRGWGRMDEASVVSAAPMRLRVRGGVAWVGRGGACRG